MARVFNFAAGPSALPESVLAECAQEMLDYRGCGMSVMEMSHRSSGYQAIFDETEATLRRLVDIPSNYHVLFLQGGATLQFAAIPMNLMETGRAGYLVTGNFANKAFQEAEKYGQADILATSEETGFDRIPSVAGVGELAEVSGYDYVYICQNNTIFGTQYHALPECGDVPLVSDVSSCFLAEPIDVTKYGVVYAGAQKNAGVAGVTIVIVRDDLIKDGPALPCCPTYLDWRVQAEKGSMLNTPNTFGIYLCGKVYKWIEGEGGLEAMRERNLEKSGLIYDYLDQSKLFSGHAEPESRSIANVTFRTASPELDAEFVAGATERGLVGVKGHRLVGGMRASVYNAVPLEGVKALVSYMEEFERAHA
jgi:phosphoserine aminotransferase